MLTYGCTATIGTVVPGYANILSVMITTLCAIGWVASTIMAKTLTQISTVLKVLLIHRLKQKLKFSEVISSQTSSSSSSVVKPAGNLT